MIDAAKIKQQAIEGYPLECVWLVYGGQCKQVKNIADDPSREFKVSRADMAAATLGGLEAIIHSHPDYPDCPSASDMRGQELSGVPWGIIATNGVDATDICWFGDQVENQTLIGRGFRHGVTDCYALIRDYYKSELGIDLINFHRDWDWWNNGGDLYRDGIKPAGFRVIDQSEAKPGDMWIAQVRSPVPNHGGILLDNGLALHHPSAKNPVDAAQLSRREPIERWLPYITIWLRHESRD